MTFAPGTKLGTYEVIAPLGEGGMGAVYRARDARLNRDVAIKVIAESMAQDDTAMARFEREAMAVASLSHPNILSIYEFSRDAGTAFVVMELVAGETLRARLEHGPIPVRKAVAYALQIAKGLGAAHARGLVHRDLKPENVMVTPDDHVKILDFGLAKSANPVADNTQLGATRLAETTPGTVLGTFGYMAPEQVRGLAVDHRADLFAFGALLYEMLSGARAFRGETAADTMSAILTKDPPDIDPHKVTMPSGLDRIVRRCLEKTPELRFQSANDLAFALETFTASSGASASNVSSSDTSLIAGRAAARARTNIWPWLIAGAALVAAAVGWIPRGSAGAAASPRYDKFTRISELAGEETDPALSPDGATVAYAVRVNNSWDIYTQRVSGRNATPILNDPQRNEKGPAFSPDGLSIAFHESDADGGIFVAGATGESVRRITDIGFHPSWSPDGKQIAFTTEEIREPANRMGDSTLYIVDAAGGKPRAIVEGDAAQAAWSPSGQRLVYWSNTGGQRDLFTVSANGGAREPLTNDAPIDWCPVWSPDGKFVFFSSERDGAMNLWRISLDQATGKPTGQPEPVTLGVQASSGMPSFSKDGSRFAFRSRIGSVNPVEIPFDAAGMKAGEPRILDSRTNIRVPSDQSPDGSLLAYYSIGDRQEDLFVGSPDGPMRRVIDDAARDRAPMFTPDGKSLVFYSNRNGHWHVWTIGLDGSGLQQITTGSTGAVYAVLSPKGDAVVSTADTGRAAFIASLVPGATSTPIAGAMLNGNSLNPTDWSPDGRRLAGMLASPSGRTVGVAIYDFATKTTSQISADETYAARWLSDSRRVVYFANGGWDVVVVDTVTRVRTLLKVRLPAPSIADVFAISRDNRFIYYGGTRAEADIWIAERR